MATGAQIRVRSRKTERAARPQFIRLQKNTLSSADDPALPRGCQVDKMRLGEASNVNHTDSFVFVIAGDLVMRERLCNICVPAGYFNSVFTSAAEFLASVGPGLPGCLLIDLDLPDQQGLWLQRQLAGRHSAPIIFFTRRNDASTCVRAMKAGAFDVLMEPFYNRDILCTIEAAIERDRMARRIRSEVAELSRRYRLLTPREREVLPLVAAGLLNKETAAELGTSEITVCVHRGQIMRKMAARSFAELVRMVDKLEIQPAPSHGYTQ